MDVLLRDGVLAVNSANGCHIFWESREVEARNGDPTATRFLRRECERSFLADDDLMGLR
ncbi:hypothetical protein Bca4012_096134 [Brassica carinata]